MRISLWNSRISDFLHCIPQLLENLESWVEPFFDIRVTSSWYKSKQIAYKYGGLHLEVEFHINVKWVVWYDD